MSISMFKKLAADPMAQTIMPEDRKGQQEHDVLASMAGASTPASAGRMGLYDQPMFAGKPKPEAQAAVDARQADISRQETARAGDSVGVMAPGFTPKQAPAETFINEVTDPANAPTPTWGVKPKPQELGMWDKAKAWGNSGDTLGMNNWQLGAAGVGAGVGAYALYKLLSDKKQSKTAGLASVGKAIEKHVLPSGLARKLEAKLTAGRQGPNSTVTKPAGLVESVAGVAGRNPWKTNLAATAAPVAAVGAHFGAKKVYGPGGAGADAPKEEPGMWDKANTPAADGVTKGWSPLQVAGGVGAAGLGAYALYKLLNNDDGEVS